MKTAVSRGLIALTLSLGIAPLTGQERSTEHLERTFARSKQPATDMRFGVAFGMAQVTDAQTKRDLASGGKGADLALTLDFPLHNHFVLGGRMGGTWLRERNAPWAPAPTASVTAQDKAFYLGFEGKYFITSANALTGPYLTATAQWTRWKKYLGLDYQSVNYGDGESLDKTSFTPSIGAGWHITRVVALDVRYTRSRFREEYSYVPGYSKDWNLDHLTFALVLRGGGKNL